MRRALLPLLLVSAAPAPQADVQLKDAAKEAQAKALMETIRCVECQGQAVADSDAAIAGSMRSIIRERIEAAGEATALRAGLRARSQPDRTGVCQAQDAAAQGFQMPHRGRVIAHRTPRRDRHIGRARQRLRRSTIRKGLNPKRPISVSQI